MPLILEYSPWLLAMVALGGISAFFSGSEAALFYLRRQDVRAFRTGNPAQRVAAQLLDRPERLLASVLFGNLVVNIGYFTISSYVSLQLQERHYHTEAGVFGIVSVLGLIFFAEMLPKTVAVLQARLLAALVGIPLAAIVRALGPTLRVFSFVNLISRRIIWPSFQSEPYLELGDLERAIELSTSDAALLDMEQRVLNSIVSLSDMRADEMMRPRRQFMLFHPPISFADLKGKMTPSGYVLVAEPDGDEVAAAIPLPYLFDVPTQHLEYHAERVVYIPWCSTGAAALEEMRRTDRRVAAVVNEYGETIGILTFDDILETIFSPDSSRSQRLLQTSSLEELSDGVWQVTGITSLRRIARHFQVKLPPTHAVTVAGILQEVLQRMPRADDQCNWGPFHFQVIAADERGPVTVQIVRLESEGAET